MEVGPTTKIEESTSGTRPAWHPTGFLVAEKNKNGCSKSWGRIGSNGEATPVPFPLSPHRNRKEWSRLKFVHSEVRGFHSLQPWWHGATHLTRCYYWWFRNQKSGRPLDMVYKYPRTVSVSLMYIYIYSIFTVYIYLLYIYTVYICIYLHDICISTGDRQISLHHQPRESSSSKIL